jgi:hypothetical protein
MTKQERSGPDEGHQPSSAGGGAPQCLALPTTNGADLQKNVGPESLREPGGSQLGGLKKPAFFHCYEGSVERSDLRVPSGRMLIGIQLNRCRNFQRAAFDARRLNILERSQLRNNGHFAQRLRSISTTTAIASAGRGGIPGFHPGSAVSP